MRCIAVVLFALLLICLAAPAAAQPPCADDEIQAVAQGDTILVTHRHAERNCCTALQLAFDVVENVVNFFEGETGELCDCMCCFDLQYSACGFAAGSYTVLAWNGDASVLHGSVAVTVGGEGQAPEIVSADRGKCVGPSPVAPSTWSVLKRLFQ